ncbi:MAG: GTPase [Candidatus Aenigmatarchaeota archaeon]|nr:50S ribosome-binding GTPase [Candidatus Aenigmarchaeota archaeon]
MTNPFKKTICYTDKELIEISFSAASKIVKKEKFKDSIIENARQKEGIRIKVSANKLIELLKNSYNSFPKNVNKFYYEITDVLIGYEKIQKSLKTIKFLINKIRSLQIIFLKKLENAKHTNEFRNIRKEFYGRVSRLLKKKKSYLNTLVEAGKVLRKLPEIKDMKTIIIAGFPNVGKSSLLWKLTGSKPEIQPYPFTTKGLMIGYFEHNFKKIQIIDTPGLLDRPISKRNKIEMQTIIALKNIANYIIYVFDLSETCGWELEKQISLYNEIKNLFNIPVILVANKIDISEKNINKLKIDNILKVSCETEEGIEDLKNEIKKLL